MMKSRLILVALIFPLTGCVSVPRGKLFSATEDEPNVAVVYVYRLNTPPYFRKPDIKVEDVVVAELPTNSYTVLKIKPGTYTIKTDWGFLDGLILNKSTKLSVAAGKSYYVNFAGRAGLIGTTVTYGPHVLTGEAAKIPPELTLCSFIAPRVPIIGSL